MYMKISIPTKQYLAHVAPAYSDLPSATIVDSWMGTGKSVWCDELALGVPNVLTVVSDKITSLSVARSRGVDGTTCLPDAPRVVAPIDCLRKLHYGPKGCRWDILIVEEYPFVADVFFSDRAALHGGGRTMATHLAHHMAGAKKVVLVSSAPSAEEVRVWKEGFLGLAGHTDVLVIKARPEGVEF